MKKLTFILLLGLGLLYTAKPTQAATYVEVPKNSGFKAYMDYRTITKHDSPQYRISEKSKTDGNGLRIYESRYCVAIGTGFKAPVGTKVNVYLDNGQLLYCVVGDLKANIHTDETHMISGHGNVVEFIVDTDTLDHDAMYHGDISQIEGFEGKVDTIVVL